MSYGAADCNSAMQDPILAKYEAEGSAYYSTARLWDDGIINPVDSRKVRHLLRDIAFTFRICYAVLLTY
jgi:3-methylcrotonyl-CoA carboxylase beta subunit